ncbi:MAG TPA: SprT family zinc-dependent metalloprotease [Oligoflexia bacterium]|nr:SprT family zinc-dependent metalloprotease [Oligoflexia bacterium]
MENRVIRYGSFPIAYEVVRSSRRRTLGISVHRDQSVQVRAPKGLATHEIDLRVEKRASWILKHQRKFALLPPVVEKKYIKGETHRYLGKDYILRPKVGTKIKVTIVTHYIDVESRSMERSALLRGILKWYSEQAKAYFPSRMEINQSRFQNLALPEFSLRVRRMRSRWGSCSPKGVITLNSRLMEHSVSVIDYVITHELCHLFIPNHSKQFYQLMSKVMPNWKELREKLKGQEGI